MKILVVCQYYYPEQFQINDICKTLSANGHLITVLTGLPNYPTGTVLEEYTCGRRRDEVIDGVHVIRSYEVGRKKGILGLGMNYVSFCLSALWKVGKQDKDFDIVFVYQLSPVLMGIPGRRYSKKYKVPLMLYCCDLWPESIKMFIKNENNVFYRFIKKVSTSLYRSCDQIFVQSKSFMPYFERVHGIDAEKLIYLPQFADDQYLKTNFLTNDQTVDFVFLGNIGIAQNVEGIIEAFDIIRSVKTIRLHVVGDGSRLQSVKRLVAEKRLDNVILLYGRRPASEMPNFYKIADACLVSLKGDNMTGLTLPSKVQGYMAAGKPIIGMIDGAANEVIHGSGCGICVPAGDIQGLAQAMRDFALNPQKYEACGENGRKYFIHNFSAHVFMESLERQMKEVIRKKG